MLNFEKLNILHFPSLDSTSTYLKTLASDGAQSGTVVIADVQTNGRGRIGRTFLSKDGGLYMSILLRPSNDLGEILHTCLVNITPLCAVAVSRAIEEVTGKKIGVKWVNDLFYENKKVCGILAEGSYSKDGLLDFIVLGIGVNVFGTFDNTELSNIATALYPISKQNELQELKKRLTNKILKELLVLYNNELSNGAFFEEYRSRLFIIGKKVEVLQGQSNRNATVLDLNRDFTLLVKFDDGCTASLNSGEVRLKVQNEP